MAALTWLIIPLVAAVLAALWGRWAGRTRKTPDGASLAGYERFRAAMEAAAADSGGDPERALPGVDAGALKEARKAARSRRTAAAQVRGEAAEEDSPRGPVVGPVP